jgi:hypothetical protein
MRGHAHVYVDGAERMMLSEKQFVLRSLKPGKHTVRVTLSGMDHKTLVRNGVPLAASVTIVVPPKDR